MADDKQLGRAPEYSGQPRDWHGRFGHITRGHPEAKYDPERRQLYRLVRPGDRFAAYGCRPSWWHLRLDRGLLYVTCTAAELPAVPPVTPRSITLGLGAIADAAAAYLCAASTPQVQATLHIHDVRSYAVAWYFLFWVWVGFARLVTWLWPPPPPPDDSFESIDQTAERYRRTTNDEEFDE